MRERLDDLAERVIVVGELQRRRRESVDRGFEIAEVIVRNGHHFEFGKVTVLHIAVELALPLLIAVHIRRVLIERTIVEVGALHEVGLGLNRLLDVLRVRIAHDRNHRRASDEVVVREIDLFAVIPHVETVPQCVVPNVAARRGRIEIAIALGCRDIFRSRQDRRRSGGVEQSRDARVERRRAARLRQAEFDIAIRALVIVREPRELRVAVVDRLRAFGVVVRVSSDGPIPTDAARFRGIVEIIERHEIAREGVMVRRDRLRERVELGIAVGALEIAEDLIVRAILVGDVDDVMDLRAQERHHRVVDGAIANVVVRIDLRRERRERRRVGNGKVEEPRFLLCPSVLVLERRVARFACGRRVPVRWVGTRIALLVDDVERGTVVRDRDARRIPTRRDAPEDAFIREVDDRERVLRAERHVETRAVGRKRQSVCVRTRETVAGSREQNGRRDRFARRIDDGDRVAVAVHDVERRAIRREREVVRPVADGDFVHATGAIDTDHFVVA